MVEAGVISPLLPPATIEASAVTTCSHKSVPGTINSVSLAAGHQFAAKVAVIALFSHRRSWVRFPAKALMEAQFRFLQSYRIITTAYTVHRSGLLPRPSSPLEIKPDNIQQCSHLFSVIHPKAADLVEKTGPFSHHPDRTTFKIKITAIFSRLICSSPIRDDFCWMGALHTPH